MKPAMILLSISVTLSACARRVGQVPAATNDLGTELPVKKKLDLAALAAREFPKLDTRAYEGAGGAFRLSAPVNDIHSRKLGANRFSLILKIENSPDVDCLLFDDGRALAAGFSELIQSALPPSPESQSPQKQVFLPTRVKLSSSMALVSKTLNTSETDVWRFAAAQVDGTTLFCRHHGLGYSRSFVPLVDELVRSIRWSQRDTPFDVADEVLLYRLKKSGETVGFVRVETFDYRLRFDRSYAFWVERGSKENFVEQHHSLVSKKGLVTQAQWHMRRNTKTLQSLTLSPAGNGGFRLAGESGGEPVDTVWLGDGGILGPALIERCVLEQLMGFESKPCIFTAFAPNLSMEGALTLRFQKQGESYVLNSEKLSGAFVFDDKGRIESSALGILGGGAAWERIY